MRLKCEVSEKAKTMFMVAGIALITAVIIYILTVGDISKFNSIGGVW